MVSISHESMNSSLVVCSYLCVIEAEFKVMKAGYFLKIVFAKSLT